MGVSLTAGVWQLLAVSVGFLTGTSFIARFIAGISRLFAAAGSVTVMPLQLLFVSNTGFIAGLAFTMSPSSPSVPNTDLVTGISFATALKLLCIPATGNKVHNILHAGNNIVYLLGLYSLVNRYP